MSHTEEQFEFRHHYVIEKQKNITVNLWFPVLANECMGSQEGGPEWRKDPN